jgi:hypothetical protein
MFKFNKLGLLKVDRQGLEPWIKAPKTSVLPLHHQSILYFGGAKL